MQVMVGALFENERIGHQKVKYSEGHNLASVGEANFGLILILMCFDLYAVYQFSLVNVLYFLFLFWVNVRSNSVLSSVTSAKLHLMISSSIYITIW